MFVDRVLKRDKVISERKLGFRVKVLATDGSNPSKVRSLWFHKLDDAEKVKPGYIIL